MVKADDDQGIRLSLVEHAPEAAHRVYGCIELGWILAWLAKEKRGRVTGNHRRDDLPHDPTSWRQSSAGLLVHGDGTIVISCAHLTLRKKLFLFDPAMRLLEHLPRIRLEDQTLSRSKCAYIDHAVILFRQLLQEVMFIAFRLKIDISLRALQRLKVALNVFRVRILVQQKTDHESRV